jgi:hypothetical protein
MEPSGEEVNYMLEILSTLALDIKQRFITLFTK